MEKWKRRAVDLVFGLALPDNQNASVVPYRPQKTEIAPPERRSLKRAAPESVGISSLRLASMLSELEAEGRARIHNLMVVKGGRVICEASAPGYSMELWHLSHSMSKTVTGMAIGLLVDDGALRTDERLVDIFPDQRYTDPRFADITVAHLLSMSSGVQFCEVGVVTESEWMAAFFGSALKFSPGERFDYNSMNSYVLARVAVKRSGKSLAELVSKRIFVPLGIRQFLWEIGPEGVEKGGFGLYLSAESWAKLGLMMLGGGKYMGRRVLSERWVSESVTTQEISSAETGDFNYGYHLWVHRRREDFVFNGMLGQNVWVCPSQDTVVVITAGNNEIFQQSPALDIVRKYLSGDISDRLRARDHAVLRSVCRGFFAGRAAVSPLERRRSLRTALGIESTTPYDAAWDALLGEYSMRKNNLSLLPIFVRCMQNNLVSGIEQLAILREGERLFMSLAGPGGEHKTEIGIYGYAESLMSFGGELYRMRTLGGVVRGAKGEIIYRIEMIFPELPNSRVIELTVLDSDRVRMNLYETPSEQIAAPVLASFSTANPKLAFAVQMLERRYGQGFIENRLKAIFSPEIMLIRRGCPGEQELLARETEQMRIDNAVVQSLASLVLRFMRDPITEQTDEERSPEQKGGALLGLLERIRRMIRGE